jgi:Protein of unknown function (DUF1353)
MSLLVNWVFVLETPFVLNISRHLPPGWLEGLAFEDRKRVRRLEIHPDGRLIVLPGYRWDGCTPKFLVWDCALGVPDGVPHPTTQKPKAYYASLVHDALYQFLGAGLPLDRATADRIFLELLEEAEFAPARFYYRVVRLLGEASRLITRRIRRYDGRRVPL